MLVNLLLAWDSLGAYAHTYLIQAISNAVFETSRALNSTLSSEPHLMRYHARLSFVPNSGISCTDCPDLSRHNNIHLQLLSGVLAGLAVVDVRIRLLRLPLARYAKIRPPRRYPRTLRELLCKTCRHTRREFQEQ